MATLNKHEDREDWVRWAIAFIRRGLWLDLEINVHGPHDSSGHMWGDAGAKLDSTGESFGCVFFAKARGVSKYEPIHIRIFMGEVGEPVDESERSPLVKISQLTAPGARRYLRTLGRTAEKLRTERNRLRMAVRSFEITNGKKNERD